MTKLLKFFVDSWYDHPYYVFTKIMFCKYMKQSCQRQ